MGEDKVNELQAQVIRLKARVLDAQDESKGLSDVLGQIAQRVGFQGQSLAELVEAVPVVDKKEEADA